MAAVQRVLIVGGGIAGPTLAVALRRLGVDVELAEIQEEWRPVGVGLTLMGPALRALGTLGLIDRAVASGASINRFAVGNERAEVTSVQELPRLNGPSYPALIQLSRPAFHGLLADAVRVNDVPVRLGVTVAAIDDRSDSAHVVFSDGSNSTYDLVVGADGVHSRIRALVFPELEGPQLTGQAVWRAMVNRPADFGDAFDSSTMYMFYGPTNKAGVILTSADQFYIFLVQNIRDTTRPTPERAPELIREQLAAYSGFLGRLRDDIVEPSQVVWRALEVLLLPAPWNRGHVILIGDAAHTTTPHLASGAGIAIEDAVVLADELSNSDRLDDAFSRFMTRRYQRCKMVVENSIQLGIWEQRPEPLADPVALTTASWAQLAEPI